MLHVGLTGNMGSGKSTVARIFSILGIPVYHADAGARELYHDPGVRAGLGEIFGSGIFHPDGSVNRQLLASIVFADPGELQKLNEYIHPLMRKAILKWKEDHKGYPYLIHEAAIIFESGFRDAYDRIIHVSCPEPVAVARVMERDGAPREAVVSRLQHQWKDEVKAALADHVILNDGSSMLLPQVLELDRFFRNPGQ